MYRVNQYKGFSLVEMSIVLIIIGLVLTGVLKGGDLIRASELRSVISQYNDFSGAAGTFYSKFGNLPGDINGASYGLDGGCNGGANQGDENGSIRGTSGVARHTGEIACFWANLTTSGVEMIKGSYEGWDGNTGGTDNDDVGVDMPVVAFGNTGWAVFGASKANFFIAGFNPAGDANSGFFVSNIFAPAEAYEIDNKIDDGKALQGAVQARRGGGSTLDTVTGADNVAYVQASACLNASDEYDVTLETIECTLRFAIPGF